ncbi:unnamed protein product [Arctogadus glacialis]
MASLLKEPLFEISAQGPAPNKDFYQLSITKSDVIWRYWKISLRNASRNAKPGEQRESHQDYLEDTRLQSQVGLVFGQGVQAYTLALGRGCYDYLERLPDALLLCILAHLQLEEVGALSQTSHRFRKLCSSEAFWEQAVRGHWETVPAEVGSLGLELGWRRLFFTSKLQLQKLISRQRQQLREEEEEGEGEGGLITEASGTPEAFWDSAGSSGTVFSSGTGDSAYAESLSDSDTVSDPHSPRESGSGSGVVDTWPKEDGVDM